MTVLRICNAKSIIVSMLLITALFLASLSSAIGAGKRHSNWSQQDSQNFLAAINGITKFAGRSLSADGWKGKWNTGSKAYNNLNPGFLKYRTKAGFENSRYTSGRTKMMVHFVMFKEARDANDNAADLTQYYRNIAQRSDAVNNYSLVRSENLGFGTISSLFVVKATSKLGTVDAKGKKKHFSTTKVVAVFVSDKWQIVINEAYNPGAVKAVMLALIEGFGRQTNTELTRNGNQSSDTKTTEDEGTVEIKLADPNDVKLGDIETSFYEVAVPAGNKLALMKEPSSKSKMIAALPNGTRDIRIRKLGYAGNRKWANLCSSGKCGWAIAKHFRQQIQQSTDGKATTDVKHFFPLKIGRYWKYETKDNGQKTRLSIDRIVAKKTIAGKEWFVVEEYEGNKKIGTYLLRYGKKGIHMGSLINEDEPITSSNIDDPGLIYKFPYKIGDVYGMKGEKWTVEKEKIITLPKSLFKCVVYLSTWKDGYATECVAEGIGFVELFSYNKDSTLQTEQRLVDYGDE